MPAAMSQSELDALNPYVPCPLEHRCVCCGMNVLPAGQHNRRGPMGGSQCPTYFNVRCESCRVKQAPIPDGFVLWKEFDAVNYSEEAMEGKRVVFELM
jgi:hypothetical protein